MLNLTSLLPFSLSPLLINHRPLCLSTFLEISKRSPEPISVFNKMTLVFHYQINSQQQPPPTSIITINNNTFRLFWPKAPSPLTLASLSSACLSVGTLETNKAQVYEKIYINFNMPPKKREREGREKKERKNEQ